MPVSGGNLKALLNSGADAIYIYDIGPHFEYYCNTEEILESPGLQGRIVEWIDHHTYAWKSETLEKHKFLHIRESLACSSLVSQIQIRPRQSVTIAYSNDVDGFISTLIALCENKMSLDGLFTICGVAQACDTADFIRNPEALKWHKAVSANRHYRLIWDLYESVSKKETWWNQCSNFKKSIEKYDKTILPANQRMIKERRCYKGVPIVNSAFVDICDISYIADYLRKQSRFLVIESNGAIKVTCNDPGINLSAIFGSIGAPFKVSIKRKGNVLTPEAIVDIILSRV